MSTLSYPYSFTPNTTIASAQVNANFNAISTLFNTTGFGDANITPAGISHISLAAASVQKDTLNSNCFDQVTLLGGAGVAASINTGGVVLSALAAAVAQALCPTGSILSYGGTSAPSGWLLCDGSSYSTTTFAALYAVVGSAFGTSSGSTFNVPDLRGQFIRGVNGGAMISGSPVDPDAGSRTFLLTGGAIGNNVGSYQTDQFASHSHNMPIGSGAVGSGTANVANIGTPFSFTIATQSLGGNQTNPRNVYTQFIIKS